MNYTYTHHKTHTLSPTYSKRQFKPIKLTKNKIANKLQIKPLYATIFHGDDSNTLTNAKVNKHSKHQTAIYAPLERMKLLKTDADSTTIHTVSTDSPSITYKLNLHTSKHNEHLSRKSIQSEKYKFPFINSFRLNNKSKTKYINNTSLLTQNVLLSPSSPSLINIIPHNNKNTFKRKSKMNHTTIGIPLLTNKCNEIENNYINIQDNILLTKCKSKQEIRNNLRNKTQKELKDRLNLMSNELKCDFTNRKDYCVKVKKKNVQYDDDIMKDVLDDGVVVNEQYHEKMFLNCRYKTFRALIEMKCIDILNPMVAYKDNKNLREHLILNEDDKYRKMLKSNNVYYHKRMKCKVNNTSWIKEKKGHSTCAEKLMKQNDEIMNLLKSTSKLKEKLYKKYDTLK